MTTLHPLSLTPYTMSFPNTYIHTGVSCSISAVVVFEVHWRSTAPFWEPTPRPLVLLPSTRTALSSYCSMFVTSAAFSPVLPTWRCGDTSFVHFQIILEFHVLSDTSILVIDFIMLPPPSNSPHFTSITQLFTCHLSLALTSRQPKVPLGLGS